MSKRLDEGIASFDDELMGIGVPTAGEALTGSVVGVAVTTGSMT